MIYQIVESHDARILTVRVNEYIKDGWYCQGGVAAVNPGSQPGWVDGSFIYFQAMIKQP